MEKEKPVVYFMIGVPGSGKTTYRSNNSVLKNLPVLSSDDIIEDYARRRGKTYSEVFSDVMKIAEKKMYEELDNLKRNGKSFIWDQTNTSEKIRAKKMNMLPEYKKVAIVFRTPNPKELERRLAQRPGKEIPPHVMKSMIDNFQMPTYKEGWDEIKVI